MDKKDKYAEILLTAYNKGIFKILWNTSSFSIGVNHKRKDMFPELKDEDFKKYILYIISIIKKMAEDKEIENLPEDDLKVAKEIYAQERDLKNHLYIKENSKINCFRFLRTQIISYRNEENPKEIEANSAIIKMIMENDDDDKSYTFEVSRRDLGDIIEQLIELKEKMDSI